MRDGSKLYYDNAMEISGSMTRAQVVKPGAPASLGWGRDHNRLSSVIVSRSHCTVSGNSAALMAFLQQLQTCVTIMAIHCAIIQDNRTQAMSTVPKAPSLVDSGL